MSATSPRLAPELSLAARALAILALCLTALLLPFASPAAAAEVDATAPALSDGLATPLFVGQTGVATATFRVTDAGSGAIVPTVTATSQAGPVTTLKATVRRTSGDPGDGTYEATVTIPEGAVGGLWDFTAAPLRDFAGNVAPSPAGIASFFVVGLGWDTTPPVLLGGGFTPSTVDLASGPAIVLATLRVKDDYTGVRDPLVELVAPDGTTVASPTGRVSGDKHEGVWGAKLTIPASAPTGAWTLRTQPLSDEGGNTTGAGVTLGTVTVLRSGGGTGGTPAGGGSTTSTSMSRSADQGGVLGTRASSRAYLAYASKRSRVAVTRKGSLAFGVKCNGKTRCRGSVRLYVKVRGKRVKVVARRVTVAAGRTTKVTFKLTKRGRTLVRRGRTVKTSLSIYTDGIKAPRTKALTFKRS